MASFDFQAIRGRDAPRRSITISDKPESLLQFLQHLDLSNSLLRTSFTMRSILYAATALLSLALAAPTPDTASTDAADAGKTGYHGDMTHYNPSAGTGSCNIPANDGENVVALAIPMMKNGPNPNTNPLCGQHITIAHGGKTHRAKIVDTCQACQLSDIDLSPTLFKKVDPQGDGRVHHVHWWFDKTSSGKRPRTHG